MNKFSINIYYLWDGKEELKDTFCTVKMRFIGPDFYSSLTDDFKRDLSKTLHPTLQESADLEFGAEMVKVKNISIREGSIDVFFSLAAIGGGMYAFFKDYESLRKGVKLFVSDLQSKGPMLLRLVTDIFNKHKRSNFNRGSNRNTISN